MMVITGTRPTRVTALPSVQKLLGYPIKAPEGMGSISPSMINMDNGAIVRNLMGATTNDVHMQRIWGTLGAAEIIDGRLRLRLGASGHSPKFEVVPKWDEMGELAAKTGHGGGDFWVLYYFARQILYGEPGPFDIYSAADCTIPGLLAYRSSKEGGRAIDVPDFRDKKQRRKYRNDHFACPRIDPEHGAFPKRSDTKVTGKFSTVISRLIRHSTAYRAYRDWMSVLGEMKDPGEIIAVVDRVIEGYPEAVKTIRAARRIIQAYPRSEGAKVLKEMLTLYEDEDITKAAFLQKVKKHRSQLKRKLKAKPRRRS
jgi:hypothetical protein